MAAEKKKADNKDGSNLMDLDGVELYTTIQDELKVLYRDALGPLESMYIFDEFHMNRLEDADFEAKPSVLLIGQYSTGKTSFIRYLLGSGYPGMRISPEPTTDSFIVIMKGNEDGCLPGNAVVVDKNMPFRSLTKFGNTFLNKFMCAKVNNTVLDSLVFVDTPGILSGEDCRANRGYDFTGILEWFASKVDRIILLFDAYKLDISDEFKYCIESLKGYDYKIRIVLNKADLITAQELMRVHGALMWSLGKVFTSPEVVRVYIGSFWEQPLQVDTNRLLFQLESNDLLSDLSSLPRSSAMRKLNDFVRRARFAKVHAYVIAALKKEMPSMFGKDSKKKELINSLPDIYHQIQREHNISPGDFPDLRRMQEQLMHQDFAKFPPLKPKLIETVDRMLTEDIARLMQIIPNEETQRAQETVRGGAFDNFNDTPFGVGRLEGFDLGRGETEWVVSKDKVKYNAVFESLGPIDGKISGARAKKELMKSKLPNNVLGKIWTLADCDKDGCLDEDEFALAMHLINVKIEEDQEIPNKLPKHLIPPSKQNMVNNSD